MPIYDAGEIQALCQLLMQQEIADQETLFKLFRYYLFRLLHAGHAFYQLNQGSARLRLMDENHQELNGLDLIENFQRQGKWVPYTTDKLALFDPRCRLIDVVERGSLSIGNADFGGYVQQDGQAYQLSTFIHHVVPIEKNDQGPFDLYIPGNQHEMIFVTDRAAGTLYVLDHTLLHIKAKLQLRASGSTKGLNLAYSPRLRKCFITDHHSPDLMILGITERVQNRVYQDYGILGNLVLDDQAAKLYVLLADPDREPAVLILSIPKLEHQGTILLPGKRFSDLDDPCDLMALSPDGKHLLVMSYTDKPALVTPLIAVIDTTTFQLLDTYELKKEEKPVGLALGRPGFSPSRAPGFDELLLEKGLVSPEELEQLCQQADALRNPTAQPILDRDVAEASNRIKDTFSEQELVTVTDMSEQAREEFLNDPVFDWKGRNSMSHEEQVAFIDKLNAVAPSKEISHTNGVFVLNWLKGLLQ